MSRPPSGEDALTIAEILIDHAAVDLAVIDSVAALAPRRELEGRLGAAARDLHGRLLAQAVHRWRPRLRRTGTALLLINQTRARMERPMGPAERTVAEPILTAATALRIEVTKGPAIREGSNVVGHHLVLRVVRHPLGIRVPAVPMTLHYGRGRDHPSVVTLDVARTHVTEGEVRHAAR